MKKLMKGICCALLLSLAACSSEEPKGEPVEKEELVGNDLYELPKNPSNAFILKYNELSDAVEKEDEEKIAQGAAVCFIFDFFTLKNKDGNSDIGGLTYLPQSRVEEFSAFAQQHYYKNYDTILADQGADSLPEVTDVQIQAVNAKEVAYLNYTYDGYVFDIAIQYASTKLDSSELKTNASVTCIVYEGKAMVIALN